jgi:formylmethanofuran dehydrogenase subunit C
MLRGAVYVSGEVKTPLGNVVEVSSDASGYRKFVSITELLERGGQALEPNFLEGKALTLKDGLIRDTLGARLDCDGRVRVEGPAGMSPGILISSGLIMVEGDCGKNAGVLMKGGRLVILGDADDFSGAEMRSGQIFIKGSAGSYCCAKMKGGSLFAREGKAVPPASVRQPDQAELSDIARVLHLNPIYAMMYRKFSL